MFYNLLCCIQIIVFMFFLSWAKISRKNLETFRNLSKLFLFYWWLSRGHTHEFIVRISSHIRSPFFPRSPLRFPVYQLIKFSFILFHHFASWIKKLPELHHINAFSRCWSFLFVLLLFLSFFPLSNRRIKVVVFLWKTEMKLDTCWWWWGLMKWFHSTSSSWNDGTRFFITT